MHTYLYKQQVMKSIIHNEVKLDKEEWKHVSEYGQTLVLSLLNKDPSKRGTIDDILKNTEWMLGAKQEKSERQKETFHRTVVQRELRAHVTHIPQKYDSNKLTTGYLPSDDNRFV